MLAVLVDEHGLRRRRAAVEADDAAHDLARLERRRPRTSGSCTSRGTRRARCSACDERRARASRRACALRPWSMNSSSRSRPRYTPTSRGLVEAVQHRAVAPRSTARSPGRRSAPRSARPSGTRSRARPGLGDAQAPALLEERQVRVRAAEQQHLAACSVLPRVSTDEVLHDDRVGQRVHDLVATGCRSSPG